MAAGALAAPGLVRAQSTLDDERAHAHFVAGESHFAAERWADATREFSLAYEMSRRPEMLINLARAHERDGQLAAAVADLELLLSLHPESSHHLEAEERLSVLRPKLAQSQAAAPVVAPVESTALPAVREEPAPVAQPLSRAWMHPRWTTLAVAGTGIAAGVVALATGLRSHNIHRDLEAYCDANYRCPEPFASDRDRGRALGRASTALSFATVALVGTAAVLWVYDVKQHDRAVAFGIDAAGARLRAEF